MMESVSHVRVPGRLPLFQVWFDIQPVSFEGTETMEDLDIQSLSQVSSRPLHLKSLYRFTLDRVQVSHGS